MGINFLKNHKFEKVINVTVFMFGFEVIISSENGCGNALKQTSKYPPRPLQ